MFWVYVLENPRGKFYFGQTENIAERVKDHHATAVISTNRDCKFESSAEPTLKQMGSVELPISVDRPQFDCSVKFPVPLVAEYGSKRIRQA